MTIYELDVAIAEQRRAALAADALRERLRPARTTVRAHLVAALRGLADSLDSSAAGRVRTPA